MWNRYYAFDIGILFAIVQRVFGDCRNLLRFGAGTHARGYYQKVVARAHAAIRAAKAVKSCSFLIRHIVGRGRVQVLGQVAYNRNIIRHIRVGDQIAFTYSQ